MPKALLQQYFCPVLITRGDWAWTNLEQEGLHNSILLLRFAPTDAASTLAHATPPGRVMQVLSYQKAYIPVPVQGARAVPVNTLSAPAMNS